MKQFGILFLAAISMFSCGKDDDGPPSDTAAIITIIAPVAGARYTNGSPLQVRGNIDDQDILKSAKVEIKNKTTGAVLFTQTSLVSGIAVYSFDWTWPVSGVTSSFTATIKITSTDQYNYSTSKEVDVLVDP